MNEVVISQPLLDNNTYNKVFRRVVKIRRSSELFENYVTSSQLEYSKFATKTRDDCQTFEEQMIKGNCFNTIRCQEAARFVKLFKEVAISIQKMTAFNMIGFKGIQNDQSVKLEELFRRRLTNFFQYLNQYNEHCKNLQKLFSSYWRKCEDLKANLDKCKDLSKPTNFYNPDASESFQQEIEEKFRISQSKEAQVTKEMQEMLARKRQLQSYVKEMKDCLVMMVKFHIGKISEMVRIVLDSITWQKANDGMSVCQSGMGPEEACRREMDALSLIYISRQQDELSQQGAFLNRNFNINQIPQDHLYFMERCQNYIKMRRSHLQQCAFSRKKLKQFLESLLQNMKNLRQGFDVIRTQCLGGPAQNQGYKNKMSKYFGMTLSEAFYLVENVVNNPVAIMSRLQQFIQTRLERIYQLIAAQQLNTTTFDQNIGTIFNEYIALRQQMTSQPVIPGQTYIQLNSNIRATFLHLKAVLNNINQQEERINRMLLEQLQGIMVIVNRQCFMHHNQLKLEKQKGNYETLRKINVDSEVLKIMNEDERYQIMFNNFYTGEIAAIQFRSYIDHAGYQSAKSLIEKKKVVSMNDRNRPFLNSCCAGSGAMKNYPGSFVYKCKLFDGKLIKGKLITLPQGIHWVSKPLLLFGNKSKLVIPKSDIKGFEMKDPDPIFVNAIVVKTQMGDINFSAFQNKDAVFEHLNKIFPIRDGHIKETGHQTDSRLSSRGVSELKMTDRSTVMNNSKIIIRRQTISSMTELAPTLQQSTYPVQTSTSIPAQHRALTFNVNQYDFSNLVNKWNISHNFFQAEFVITEIRRDQNWIRLTYEARFYGIRTILKELKSVTFTQNLLQFDFKWKISFPDNPNIKSFSILQHIRVQPSEQTIRIHVLTKKPAIYSSYLQDIFYESLKKMDEALTEFISRTIDKECEVDYQSEVPDNLIAVPSAPRDASLRSELKRDVSMVKSARGSNDLRRNESILVGASNQLIDSVRVGNTPKNQQTYLNPLVNTITSEIVLNSPELLEPEPIPPLTNNSVEGRPEEVRIILTAFFILFLALFLM